MRVALFRFPLAIAAFLFTANTYAAAVCGSKTGYLNQLAATFLVPDQFPPETELLKNLVADADHERCQKLAIVSLAESCQAHDRCYESRRPKADCDRALKASWLKACGDAYRRTLDAFICRSSCRIFVELMSQAQSFHSGAFCPSCDAYSQSF